MSVSGLVAAALVMGLLSAPHGAEAQPPGKMHRVGLLGATSASGLERYVEAFRDGLRQLGYVEGRDIAIEYRFAEGGYERLSELAAELVRLEVDVIVTHGTPGTQAAKEATRTIPIVMALVGDAVSTRLVVSMARPGGNVTGSSFPFAEVAAKRLELLRETVPTATRIGVLLNPVNPANVPAIRKMEPAARSLGVELLPLEVRRPDELEAVLSRGAAGRVDAVTIIDDPMFISHARQIAELALRSRLPTIGFRGDAEAGGLMAYGKDFADLWRRAALFVDRILKGARPADVPVEQPTRFELVINRKTAHALGVTIPESILLRTDAILE
jgi:putative ABC transport system substrate-binding protein